ncbi:MAG: ribosome-associated translation inhibitor RaiA [Deferribacteraceae bacterium]|jgi:putative sigma-54 modulation protein|nr:ribosome-associated translation inhibitor RaiA [Deferribacteraceae bacterium]
MNINIVSKGLKVTEAMRSYSEKKLARIKKYFASDTVDFTVTFAMQHKNSYVVEVLAHSKGLYLKGVETSSDPYAALDLVVDKIERQVVRYKDRISQRKHAEHSSSLQMAVYEAASVEEEKPEVIISKSIDVKPMSVEEAAMQMDLMNKDFFVFRNEVGALNVVYKRDDGNIGLFN